jgi:hypothetical protein
MNATTSFRLVLTLSLIGTFVAVVGPSAAFSESVAAPGSVGSHPGKTQQTPTPAKPRGSPSDRARQSMRPSDIPGQTTVPSEQLRALEERLRSGQMERPIAQDQVSDRLEQLHSGSAERSTGDTTSRQSVQGDMPY